MICARWPQEFRRLLGDGGIPNTYLSLDIETSGYDMKKDVVTEIGHCLVRDGEEIDRVSVILDWTDHDVVDGEWLRYRLAQLNMHMAPGREQHITLDSMRERGVKPAAAFDLYGKLVASARDKNLFIVGHNHLAFDEKMLQHNVVGFGYAEDFELGPNVFDVHAVERANQMEDDDRTLPRAGETVRQYMKRMAYMKPRPERKILSNLTPFCARKYRLEERFGVNLEKSHQASYDAYLVHLVIQSWREELRCSAAAGPAAQPPAQTVSVSPVAAPPAAAPRSRRRGQRNR